MRPITEYQDLKELLQRYGLSINWAGKQIGVSGAYLAIVISGKVEPSEKLKTDILRFREKILRSGLRAV